MGPSAPTFRKGNMRIGLLILAIMATGADATKGLPDKELDHLQGEWAGVSFEANGNSVSTTNAGWRVVVKGKTVDVQFGIVPFDGTLVLGSAGGQKTLDIVETKSGGNPVRMEISGIYKLEQDKLTVCYRFGSNKPPSEFRTAATMDTMMQVFKRAK
jgi:uncharacterized protein (TIGR03067 family)